ncbi:hypothetical protein [Winogradskyella pulchriflava]|uniref:Uncharacterized protein n=1 Tax=Winogradskyella pulchriflava TaxID=1110688 RepID=A0ABV6QDX7_9FLAO
MSKPKIQKDSPDVALRYMHWLAQMIDMIKPTNLFLILGRAGAKTVQILSKRFMDISKEMPGAFVSVSADTYMNAIKNILPNIIKGWELNGWIEGIHFVVDKRPPKHFKKPHKSVLNWKHTLTTYHGTHFKIISQDRPSAGAGDSYQHNAGDEAKYLNEKKLNKISQASRGEYVRYHKSPYYLGSTFTTDMPNTNLGEHDWILSMEENMDNEQIKLILQVAFILNDEKIKLVKKQRELQDHPSDSEIRKDIKNIERNIKRWKARYNKVRKNSTFFYIGSSYVNADILTESYFVSQFEKGNFKELATALLSITPQLEKGLMFYPNLSERNFYSDGFTYKRIDKSSYASLQLEAESSLDLKYINHNLYLEGGFDSGNMCSLVVGQELNNVRRALKEFYTLPPNFIKQLGQQFVEYFKHHQTKELILWHDRATNKYKRVGEDHASKLKYAIEKDAEGNSTGWTVVLKNRNQATIYQETEYELALQLFSGENNELPQILIDKHNCPNLKSSLERAQKIERVDREGNKTIHKDKSSEKLPDERLPSESTNFSDAFKYFICTPENLEKIEENPLSFIGNPTIK